ncbi:hypothetical protein AMECASPLE_029233 [Ameca splendens]|uniref:Uncharacterized protein n=1 Tax=Ameca splendens TaxID=208324 RepID=A0ABV0YSR5_9TELE
MQGCKKMRLQKRTQETREGWVKLGVVVQQLDIDQGCEMTTRHSIVSSVCSVPPQPSFSICSLCVSQLEPNTLFYSLFAHICQTNIVSNVNFIYIAVFIQWS